MTDSDNHIDLIARVVDELRWTPLSAAFYWMDSPGKEVSSLVIVMDLEAHISRLKTAKRRMRRSPTGHVKGAIATFISFIQLTTGAPQFQLTTPLVKAFAEGGPYTEQNLRKLASRAKLPIKTKVPAPPRKRKPKVKRILGTTQRTRSADHENRRGKSFLRKQLEDAGILRRK